MPAAGTTEASLKITSITADVVMDSPAIRQGQVLMQKFSVKFVEVGASTPVVRSGAPGYIIGKPVLAGAITTAGNINLINYIPDPYFGISLVKDMRLANNIGCPVGTTEYTSREPVRFGQNSQTGCSLWLKMSDFSSQASCDSLRTRIYNLQTLTAQSKNRIGRFGNASVNNEFDWIPIINDIPAAIQAGSSSAQTASRTCSNLLTEFKVEFLYSAYGIASNPQLAVVGARYSYTTGSFSWICNSNSDCIDPQVYTTGTENVNNIGITVKPFQIKSSVSFVRIGSSSTPYSSDSPSLISAMPDGIWYPFNIPSF